MDYLTIEYTKSAFTVGDYLTGVILFKPKEEFVCQGIFLSVKGRAKVHFTLSRASYETREDYLNVDDFEILPTGPLLPVRHEIPFRIKIPANLPSTHKSSYGDIKYTCKLKVLRRGLFNLKSENEFKIIRPLDLNTLPGISERARYFGSTEDRECECCGWTGGYYTAIISLPRSGYIPGDIISVTLALSNRGCRRVDKIEIILQQVITYSVKSSSIFGGDIVITHQLKMNISQATTQRPEPFTSSHETRVILSHIFVPSSLPSGLKGCNCIDICYDLLIITKSSGGCLNVKIPIVIGSVALENIALLARKSSTSGGSLCRRLTLNNPHNDSGLKMSPRRPSVPNASPNPGKIRERKLSITKPTFTSDFNIISEIPKNNTRTDKKSSHHNDVVFITNV